MRDRAHAAAAAAAVPLAAMAGAGLATGLADALALPSAGGQSADGRFALVALGMVLPIWLARLARPGSSRRARIVVALLGVPWLGLLAVPVTSAAAVPFVTWVSGGVLVLGLDAVVWAGRTAARLGASRASAIGLAILVGAPGLYFVSAAGVLLVNTQILIAPVRLAHLDPARDDGERALALRTSDGLRIAATETPAPAHAPGVVLVHGVADGRDRMRPWAERLGRAGSHVIRIDVRGHGRSDGSVCTYGQNEHRDVVAAVDHLRAAGAAPISVVGTSMGGGIVMAAAPRLEARGVHALVTMAPASDFGPLVARRVRLLGPLAGPVLRGTAVLARAMGQRPMTRWRPADGLDASRLPVLVLHGTADDVVPLAMSERLSQRLGDRVRLVPLEGVGHVEIPAVVAQDDALWATVEAFLRDPSPR